MKLAGWLHCCCCCRWLTTSLSVPTAVRPHPTTHTYNRMESQFNWYLRTLTRKGREADPANDLFCCQLEPEVLITVLKTEEKCFLFSVFFRCCNFLPVIDSNRPGLMSQKEGFYFFSPLQTLKKHRFFGAGATNFFEAREVEPDTN